MSEVGPRGKERIRTILATLLALSRVEAEHCVSVEEPELASNGGRQKTEAGNAPRRGR